VDQADRVDLVDQAGLEVPSLPSFPAGHRLLEALMGLPVLEGLVVLFVLENPRV
jgi:hypothetical protein